MQILKKSLKDIFVKNIFKNIHTHRAVQYFLQILNYYMDMVFSTPSVPPSKLFL